MDAKSYAAARATVVNETKKRKCGKPEGWLPEA